MFIVGIIAGLYLFATVVCVTAVIAAGQADYNKATRRDLDLSLLTRFLFERLFTSIITVQTGRLSPLNPIPLFLVCQIQAFETYVKQNTLNQSTFPAISQVSLRPM